MFDFQFRDFGCGCADGCILEGMNGMMSVRVLGLAGLLAGTMWGQVAAPAAPQQQGLNTPATRSAGQAAGKQGEAPLDTPAAQADGDASATASPVPRVPAGTAIRVGSEVRVAVVGQVSSGSLRNGDKVQGTLAAALRTTTGTLPVGTAVTGTVVSSAKAGEVQSGGVLSLQLTKVGGVHVITDVLDFNGKEGHKDVADSAPAKGSEATVAAGTVLDFHVMQEGKATGLMKGVPPAKGAGGAPQGSQPGKGQAGQNGTPSTGPGVNQTPVQGATQGVVPQASSPR